MAGVGSVPTTIGTNFVPFLSQLFYPSSILPAYDRTRDAYMLAHMIPIYTHYNV